MSKRKRVFELSELYPSPKKFVRWLDKFLVLVAIVGPLVNAPQIWKIYWLKDATGVSILTWGFLTIGCIPWVAYGLVHKEKPIIISYSLWFVLNLVIVAGVLIYG